MQIRLANNEWVEDNFTGILGFNIVLQGKELK